MKKKKGFTLVELAIVISVIAILAAVLIPTFSGIVQRAKESARIQSLTGARDEFFTGSGKFESLEDMEGYIFKLDDRTYVIENGKIVACDIDVVGATNVGTGYISNNEIEIYMPTDETQPTEPELPGNEQLPAGSYVYVGDELTISQTWDELVNEGLVVVENNVLVSVSTDIVYLVINEGIIKVDTYCAVDQTHHNYLLTNVILPESLTEIGVCAFFGCYNLQSIHFGRNVQELGDSAFGHTALTEITVDPENATFTSRNSQGVECNVIVNKNYGELRLGCSTSVIPDNCYYIGQNAFFGSAISSLTIPSNITAMSNPFGQCNNLVEVTIPDSVVSMDGSAFSECANLESIYIGSGLRDFDVFFGCFTYCPKLTSIVVSEDNPYFMTSYQGTVLNCLVTKYTNAEDALSKEEIILYKGFTNTIIPEYVTTISHWAFAFQGITSIRNSESTDYYDEHPLVIPDSVKIIRHGAFSNCSSITVVELPDSIEEMEGQIFEFNSIIETIVLPSSLKYLGAWSLSSMYGLTSIYIGENVERIGQCIANSSPLQMVYFESLSNWITTNYEFEENGDAVYFCDPTDDNIVLINNYDFFKKVD